EKVEQQSGLPFNRTGLMERMNFVYNSEAICRAVVTTRIIAPDSDLLEVFRALQRALYVDGLDTTDSQVLAAVASAALQEQGCSVSAGEFLGVWSEASTIRATQADFARTHVLAVTSFPTLFKEEDGTVQRIGNGYASVDEIERQLDRLAA
ncbi:MAG: DsbA family protein, partial [Pseudomonadota bacterium]|nr:DsbA family protein [Pseudomonadota bacterium]